MNSVSRAPHMPAHHSHFSRTGLILLALLTLGWGINWPIMKIVLRDVPPLSFRGLCLLAGGVGVLALARIVGQPLSLRSAQLPRLLLLTALNIVGWNVFAIYGVALLPSGRAALLGYTMPLWSMLFSVWLLHDRLSARGVVGLALGLAGVFVLMGHDLVAMSSALAGVACMLAAAFAWGLGMVLLKRFAVPMPTLALTGWMMLLGGVPITLAAVALEHDAWRPLGVAASLGMLYNAVVAFMFCYWAWNRIVLMVPVAVSSLSSLVTPVVGVLSGMAMLGETLGWQEVIAAALILGAIRLVLLTPRVPPA
jgi:drug/metabolite transporter (DMT)-like permease